MLVLLSLLVSGANYLNQLSDFKSDQVNEKLGFLQQGIITPVQMRSLFLFCTIVPMVTAPFISSWILLVFAQLALLGIMYSVEPISLMKRPISGLFVNAYCFGTLVPLTVMPHINMHNAGLLGWDNPLFFFLAVGAIHLLTTIPDMAGDRESGKRTLGLLLGERKTKLLALLFLITAIWVAFESSHAALVYLALMSAMIVSISALIPWRQLTLVAAKLPILLTTLLAGWYYPIYFLFIVVLIILTRVYYLRRFNMVYPRLG
ncbi:MAG: UbiA family prenyltransferase [bacterium]|nr:UbiA family prenyltransferase [bacterium]